MITKSQYAVGYYGLCRRRYRCFYSHCRRRHRLIYSSGSSMTPFFRVAYCRLFRIENSNQRQADGRLTAQR